MTGVLDTGQIETGPLNLGNLIDRSLPDGTPWLVEIAEDGSERRFDYGNLRADTAAVGRGLRAQGLGVGARVGILSANRAEYLLAYFGAMQAGLCVVPVNHKLPRDTIAHIVADAGLEFVLVNRERAPLVDGAVPSVRIDDPAAWDALLDPGPLDPVSMPPEAFANILYTSGSSGRPKGVPLTHGGYVWAVQVLKDYGAVMGKGQRVLVAAPLFHMNALFMTKLVATYGGMQVLMERFTAQGYLDAIDRHRCTTITSVPTMLALIAREQDHAARLDLSSVRAVIAGSAPATEALFERMRTMFPSAMVVNGYGTTESSPVAFGPHPEGLPRPPLSLGYPSAHAELKLVGGEDANHGVLWIRNRAIMPGYLNLPEETAKRVRDGWYATGDVMRRDENGFFFFVGRDDDMFNCGGENIYPGEVEKLLERHPAVAQAAVVPLPDEIKGQLPVAFVVPRPGQAPDAEEIRQFALANGPAYQHPRFVEFMAELPLAGTNKIDRRTLAERAAALFRR